MSQTRIFRSQTRVNSVKQRLRSYVYRAHGPVCMGMTSGREKAVSGSGSRTFWLPSGFQSPTTGYLDDYGQRAMGKRWAMQLPSSVLSIFPLILIISRT